MPVKPPSSAVMLVSVARSSVDSARTAGAAELEHLADAGAGADRRLRQQVQHDVLGGDAGRQLALELDAQHCGTRQAHRAGDEGVGHVGGADAEGHAAQRAAVRRVRIGADDHLARQRVVLGHHRVRDAGDRCCRRRRGLGFGQRAVRRRPCRAANSRCARNIAAHVAAPGRRARGPGSGHVGGVVLEDDDASRLVQRAARRRSCVQHVGAHAGVVLVDEAPVGAHEGAFARAPGRPA